MADTGNSATISFGTSTFTANYHSIGGLEETLDKIEDSHLGTSTRKTYIPGDLAEPGEIACEFEYDPDDQPPIGSAPETITITYPKPSGASAGATLAGTGFIISRKTPDLKNNELMVGEFTIAFDGKTGPTFTAATTS
jgi:hypothetical protein